MIEGALATISHLPVALQGIVFGAQEADKSTLQKDLDSAVSLFLKYATVKDSEGTPIGLAPDSLTAFDKFITVGSSYIITDSF